MSSSIKTIKKLAKAGKYYNTQSGNNRPANAATIKQHLNEISIEATQRAARELLAPLTPLLSWLEIDSQPVQTTSTQPAVVKQEATATPISMARLPYKSPPCKGCPAKQGGLCKCAQKRMQLRK